MTGPIPETGKIRRKKTTKDDPFGARDAPATSFPHEVHLPKEVQLMIRAIGCNYELYQDHIIEARLNILWRPSSIPGEDAEMFLYLDSPPGPYMALYEQYG